LYKAASSRSRVDDTDLVAHRGQQLECGEAAVGDKDEQTVWATSVGL
jgi:hypothetical protein